MAATDIAVIGGGMAAMQIAKDCAKGGTTVTLCMANPFLEWPMTGTAVIANPEIHSKWVCPNQDDFKQKGVDYIFDLVTEIDPGAKTIRFGKHADLSYKAVVIASGSKLPLIAPKPGDSLEQRIKEVKEVGAAIAGAQTVIVNGPGLVGVELVGDLRAVHPEKRVILLSRDGKVCGATHPPEWQEKVKDFLTKKKIEVTKGTVPKSMLGGGVEPSLSPGSIQLESGELISYDVFLPAFAQGPNTQFLANSQALNERGQLIVNECLQSTKHPEIFGAAVTTVPLEGHPASVMVCNQAASAARNAKLFISGKAPTPHKGKGDPRPINVKFGLGPGGYVMWDHAVMPCPMKFCCCLPCGGFPCCPPPCCWCCAPGCSTCFGNCCGPVEGEGGALFVSSFMYPKFAPSKGYKGMGKPAQQSMS